MTPSTHSRSVGRSVGPWLVDTTRYCAPSHFPCTPLIRPESAGVRSSERSRPAPRCAALVRQRAAPGEKKSQGGRGMPRRVFSPRRPPSPKAPRSTAAGTLVLQALRLRRHRAGIASPKLGRVWPHVDHDRPDLGRSRPTLGEIGRTRSAFGPPILVPGAFPKRGAGGKATDNGDNREEGDDGDDGYDRDWRRRTRRRRRWSTDGDDGRRTTDNDDDHDYHEDDDDERRRRLRRTTSDERQTTGSEPRTTNDDRRSNERGTNTPRPQGGGRGRGRRGEG